MSSYLFISSFAVLDFDMFRTAFKKIILKDKCRVNNFCILTYLQHTFLNPSTF